MPLLTPVGPKADGNALHWSNRARREATHLFIPIKTFTKLEVADLLQVTTRTVENLVRKGILPVIKIGGIVRFPAEEFRAALESYTVNKRPASKANPAQPAMVHRAGETPSPSALV